MNKFKLLTLILVLLFVLASCNNGSDTGDDSNNNQNTVNGGNSNDTTEEEVSVSELYPYPEHDFGGAVINVVSRKDGWADGSQDFDDITVEGETGEVLNDAVYTRTKKVEDKYNVEMKVTHVTDPIAIITKSIKAGDDEYQLIQEKLVHLSSNLAAQNYLTDLRSISAMNLDAPWYNQNAIKDLSINNKVTAIGGDMTVSDKSGVIMFVFNKKILTDYGLENLYATVREGKWTLDKLYEIMVQSSKDINGDGTLTIQDDQWGFVCEDYAGWMLSVASGNRLASLDSNGLPFMSYNTEKTVNDYERIKKILYEDQSRASTVDPAEYERIFTENRALLALGMLSQFTAVRAMEEDFGIIPMPKQDESQSGYISTISPWVSRFIAMPSTCGNPDMLGAVIDALSRESTNTVVPAYYNNLLNQKIARDEESVEMLEMIFNSVVYDIGSVFSWGDIWNEQLNFISGKKEDYLGYHERIEGKIQSALEKTIETMQSYE